MQVQFAAASFVLAHSVQNFGDVFKIGYGSQSMREEI